MFKDIYELYCCIFGIPIFRFLVQFRYLRMFLRVLFTFILFTPHSERMYDLTRIYMLPVSDIFYRICKSLHVCFFFEGCVFVCFMGVVSQQIGVYILHYVTRLKFPN